MSFRSSWVAGGLALAFLACGDAPAQVPPAPAKPLSELGKPSDTGSFTNVTRRPRKDGLRYLEEELGKLQPFSSKKSLDGVLAPPYQPPAPAPVPPPRVIRTERPKDWTSSLETESSESDRLAEMFKVPGSEPSTKKSKAFDEFYEQLNKTQSRSSDLETRSTSRRKEGFNSREEDDLPSSIREKQQSLKEKLSGSESSDRIYNPGGLSGMFSDVFSPKDTGLSREQIQAHKENLDRYRQLLGSTAPSATTFQDSRPSTTTTPIQPSTFGGMDSLGALKRDTFASTPGTAGMIRNPARFQDPSAGLLNQWNPLYQPPQYDPPKPPSQPLSTPFMETPRRRF